MAVYKRGKWSWLTYGRDSQRVRGMLCSNGAPSPGMSNQDIRFRNSFFVARYAATSSGRACQESSLACCTPVNKNNARTLWRLWACSKMSRMFFVVPQYSIPRLPAHWVGRRVCYNRRVKLGSSTGSKNESDFSDHFKDEYGLILNKNRLSVAWCDSQRKWGMLRVWDYIPDSADFYDLF